MNDTTIGPGAGLFCHHIRVRFAETDAMGIVHHSSYLLYLEEARVAYLAAIGYPYERLRQEGTDFAVIEVQVRYVIPLLFDDVVAITLTLSEAKGATFVIDYTLRRTESVVATARTRHGAIGANRRPKRLPTWMLALGGRG